MQIRDIGDLPRLENTFRVNNVPTDPTLVQFTYEEPDGTLTTLVYGVDGALVRTGAGVYYVDLNLTDDGYWSYQWVGTGAAQGTEEHDFEVRSRLTGLSTSTTKRYIPVREMELWLNTSFSAEQYFACRKAIEGITVQIDRETGRSWLNTSPTTEVVRVYSPYIRLAHAPVTAVTSVAVRRSPFVEATTLTSTQYSLYNATRGIIALDVYPALAHVPWDELYAQVTYTHSGPPVPADIALACRLIVAQLMRGPIEGVGADVKRYSIGIDLEVERFSSDVTKNPLSSWPPEAQAIIRTYRNDEVRIG